MPRDALAAYVGFFPDAMHALMDISVRYGFLGLFISSLVGSTIFVPFSAEAALILLYKAGLNPYLLVVIAAVGSLMGTWVNYGLGYFGSELVGKKIGEANMKKGKDFMDKYGWPGLFLVIFLPTPIPVDPVTVIPGLTRMNFAEFSVIVFIAKLARYAVVVEIVAGLFSFMRI